MRTELSFWLARLHRAYHAVAWEELDEHGYYPIQEWLMLELWDTGGARFSTLRRRLGMSSASLSRTLRRMSRGQLIETVVAPRDRQDVFVRPTQLSRFGEPEVRATIRYMEDELWRNLTTAQREEFGEMLRGAAQSAAQAVDRIRATRARVGPIPNPVGRYEP